MDSGVYVGRNGVIDGKLRLMVVDEGCKEDCAATYLDEHEAFALITTITKSFNRDLKNVEVLYFPVGSDRADILRAHADRLDAARNINKDSSL